MRSLSAIIYMGAVVVFIGWLWYRMRALPEQQSDADDAHEPRAGAEKSDNEGERAR